MLMRKAWRIDTSDEDFAAVFRSRQCLGGHEHEEVMGRNAKLSAYYPRSMCESIVRTWLRQKRSSSAT